MISLIHRDYICQINIKTLQQFSVKMYILIILDKYGGLNHCDCD